MRRGSVVLVVVGVACLMLASGCDRTLQPGLEASQEAEEAAEEAGPPPEDAGAAFEELHPGFTAGTVDGGGQVWDVNGRSVDVPAFYVSATVSPTAAGEVTATVAATVWSTSADLQEVTENSELLTGDMRVQFMEAVVDDLGWSEDGPTGGYIVTVGVISNVEMRVSVRTDVGEQTDYLYQLDLASGDWVPAG